MYHLKDRGFVHPDSAEITPAATYARRRDILKALAAGAAGSAVAAFAGRDALA